MLVYSNEVGEHRTTNLCYGFMIEMDHSGPAAHHRKEKLLRNDASNNLSAHRLYPRALKAEVSNAAVCKKVELYRSHVCLALE